MIVIAMSLAAAAIGVQANAAETAVTSAATAAAPTPAAKDKKRYCVEETLTGSRLPRKSCRTRAEWLALGWDPLKPE